MLAARKDVIRRNVSDQEFRSAFQTIRDKADRVVQSGYRVDGSERGDWTHYYYCREDGAQLQFNWESPKSHRCPVCCKEWAGERYNGAWVSVANIRLGEGLKLAALLGMTGNADYAQHAVAGLLSYAEHYGTYKVHGDIPYNGPGKLYAQTLDEAHWIIDLCLAYWMIESNLADAQRHLIQEGLFRPCAEFLIEHKERQVHNHAVLITSAIAMLGYLLADRDVMEEGLQGDYGLLDQMERGVLPDGFWYEGAFSYHFYGLYPFLQFALLVENTEWDIRNHPKLKKMFDFPLSFILPDGSYPSINDSSSSGSLQSYAHFYEIAYDWFGEPKYQELLRLAYGLDAASAQGLSDASFVPVQRMSLDALLFGQPLEVKEQERDMSLRSIIRADASSEGSGLTKLVNRNDWHLLVKHSPFGGEHDHMDRLGLSFGSGSTPLMIDPGTTAYGVPMHYAWFKHTYSHNTVCLNGHDQPPSDGRRLQFRDESWGCIVETAVDWNADDYRMRDCIQLPPEMCPWNEQAYAGARIRRINIMTDQLILDIVKVFVPEQREIDILMHISGHLGDQSNWERTDEALSRLSPALFRNKQRKPLVERESLAWTVGRGNLRQYSWCSRPALLIIADTPGNPPNTNRQSLIQRAWGDGETVFVNAFHYDAEGSGDLESVVSMSIASAGSEEELRLTACCSGQQCRVVLQWGEDSTPSVVDCQLSFGKTDTGY